MKTILEKWEREVIWEAAQAIAVSPQQSQPCFDAIVSDVKKAYLALYDDQGENEGKSTRSEG